MILPVLNLLSILALVAFCSADDPGGYVNPASLGGNMTATPANSQNKGTGGKLINVIISNKSDHSLLSEDGMSTYLGSLGYESGPCHAGDRLVGDQANVGNGKDTIMSTVFTWHSPRCDLVQNPSLRFNYWTQTDSSKKQGAHFIAAAVVLPNKEGDQVVENGYDLGRDEFVAQATVNNTNTPVARRYNNTLEYRTQVVYNDTELLSNISAHDLQFNVGTDGRVPILLVSIVQSSSNETAKVYPIPHLSHPGSQASLASNLLWTVTVTITIMAIFANIVAFI